MDLIHAVEMEWLQVEPTLPSPVKQNSDFLNSMLWAKTGRGAASYVNVDGKFKGLKISACLTPTLWDLITRRLDTDRMSEFIIWTVSEMEKLQLTTQTAQGVVAINTPGGKRGKQNTPT